VAVVASGLARLDFATVSSTSMVKALTLIDTHLSRSQQIHVLAELLRNEDFCERFDAAMAWFPERLKGLILPLRAVYAPLYRGEQNPAGVDALRAGVVALLQMPRRALTSQPAAFVRRLFRLALEYAPANEHRDRALGALLATFADSTRDFSELALAWAQEHLRVQRDQDARALLERVVAAHPRFARPRRLLHALSAPRVGRFAYAERRSAETDRPQARSTLESEVPADTAGESPSGEVIATETPPEVALARASARQSTGSAPGAALQGASPRFVSCTWLDTGQPAWLRVAAGVQGREGLMAQGTIQKSLCIPQVAQVVAMGEAGADSAYLAIVARGRPLQAPLRGSATHDCAFFGARILGALVDAGVGLPDARAERFWRCEGTRDTGLLLTLADLEGAHKVAPEAREAMFASLISDFMQSLRGISEIIEWPGPIADALAQGNLSPSPWAALLARYAGVAGRR
jgi:hypothetical protein